MKIKDKDIKKGILLAVILTLWLRLVFWVIGSNFAHRFTNFPLTTREMDLSENIPRDQSDPWYYIVSPLHRFDALWYEEIAKTNYIGRPLATAFFPLYPWTVKIVSGFIHQSYPVSAFLLNTIFTVSVFYLLYYLALMEYGARVAFRTVVIYALFPASFFLLVPYAEPMLFVLILLSLIWAKKSKTIPSSAAGALACAVKPYAIIILIPLLIIQYKKNKSLIQKIKSFIPLLLLPLTYISVILHQNQSIGEKSLSLGNRFNWISKVPYPWEPIISQIRMFTKNSFDIPNDINLLLVLFVLIYLICTFKKIRLEYWLFVAFNFFVFYFFQYRNDILFSMSRHSLILFPFFIYLGKLKVGKLVEIIYLISSVTLLIILFIYYTFGFFVA